MPYDSNGNFSLVPSYKATAGETIRTEQHNPPLEDIASGLSGVLLRSGVAPMMAPLNMNGYSLQNLGESSAGNAPATNDQLNALAAVVEALVPTGTVLGFRRTTAPAGWVKENGGTIGNVSSGATTRASADTEELFALLWTTFSNTVLPIQNSDGSSGTRGASAAADFAANKRMPLFDSRTRFHRGADDGLGFDAGLTVGTAQDDALKAHTHTGTTNSAGAHYHNVLNVSNFTGAAGSAERYAPGGGTLPTSSAGEHAHPFTTNSTGETETRPRSSVLLYCIKL